MKSKLAVSLLVFAVSALPASAQEVDPKVAEEINEALTELAAAIKGKTTSDQIHFVKVVGSKWKHADSKQRKTAFGLMKKNLKSKERDVREATIVALGQMGGGKKDKDAKKATKMLLSETGQKRTKADLDMFVKCLKSVGRLMTKDGAKSLVKLLRHKDNEVIAGSMEGMVHYRDAKHELRKELVGEVIKTYTSIFGQSRDVKNKPALKKLQETELQAEGALAALSKRTDIKGAQAWRKWWNKEGKKSSKW